MKISLKLILVLALLLSASPVPAKKSSALLDTPSDPAALRESKLKLLYRRKPEAKDLIAALEKRLSAEESSPGKEAIRIARKNYLETAIMSGSSFSGKILRQTMKVLRLMDGPIRTWTGPELASVKEKYENLCLELDDQIFIKDLDSVLKKHDLFIRKVKLGLLTAQEAEAELQSMMEAYESAPEIPYGRLELLREFQGKKIAPPAKGCYTGVWPNEEIFLADGRHSSGILEGSTGATLGFDTADHRVSDSTGSLHDLNEANWNQSGYPLSPPLILWLKSRLLEGRIPAVMFDVRSVNDVLDGTLDEYFKRNLKLIASTKAATMVGLFNDFDRMAGTAFGADGRTPYYQLLDKKLSKLEGEKKESYINKKLAKGAYLKEDSDSLKNRYGDSNIPDGPERVKQAWKRFKSLADEAGATSVSLFSCAGEFHGNRQAYKIKGQFAAGAQSWNNLSYYWPGPGVIDWLGTRAVAGDIDKDGNTVAGAIQYFMNEMRTTAWNETPVFLRDVAPDFDRDPFREADWLVSCFQGTVQRHHPDIKLFFITFPGKISLWMPEGIGAFRRAVSSNPHYNQRLRFFTPKIKKSSL